MNQPASQVLPERGRVSDSAQLHACTLGVFTEVGERCKLNNITLGDYSYVESDSNLMYCDVGKFCSIAAAVRINPSNHPWWRASQHHFTYRAGKYGMADDLDDSVFNWRQQDSVRIGHDVWIGHGAILLPGVNVGNGAIIGAGSVVTKDVPAWHIVVGNPAKVLRPRFSDPAISKRLEAIAWWDWPLEKIEQYLPLFRQDAEQFVQAVS
ncbi:DapH/DapD/GlmU-related protein [Salinibius halmophilus]|uniref:DapH/DapD/GlmU-related protein n=1 Tax=Salinibius halmophilus TaxID=1853216 RepID=UPI000E669B26|nr:DapH/DapD/GlmU-related protein [Salinibius halmophilus]